MAPSEVTYKKRAIPQASRRSVALANGATPGTTSIALCNYCGEPGQISWPLLYLGRPGAWVSLRGLEFDHVIPEVRGGSSDPENLVLACRRCNRSKKDKVL